MSDDRLIPPPRVGASGRAPLPAEQQAQAAPQPYAPEQAHPVFEDAGESVDLRRYLFAILRYKWLVVAAALLGSMGAVAAWRFADVSYTAEGSLWIEVEGQRGSGDVTPMRAGSLLESNAWIELLRSYAVLDSVVIEQGLYIEAPDEFAAAFADFELGERFAPGSFELTVGPTGEEFTLAGGAGVVVQQGRLGEAIGVDLGFLWRPAAGAFPPDAVVPFTVRTPRDAAQLLSTALVPRMDQRGNFLRVSYQGTNPVEIANVLNAVMERHVALAADIKRARLEETLVILEEQLRNTEADLAEAEGALEQFRVETISLPSDRAPIAAGLGFTRDPVMANFFEMRLEIEQVRHDHARLQTALSGSAADGGIRIEALEVIPIAANSSELSRLLTELVDVRSNLRVLRDRYSDDYPPIQTALVQLQSLEQRDIPRVVGGLLGELAAQEGRLQSQLDAASADLEAIPPRTINESRLERSVTITANLYNELRSRVETARLAAASSIPDVRILDRAQVPQRPTNDQRLMFAAAIFLGFLGMSMGGAVFLDRTDARFRYAGDVGRDIGLDILGSIPRIESSKGRKGVLNAAQALEAFRELRIHVGFAYGSAGPITLAISSPSAGEGKSLIASNLAVAFSEVGQRTLLIDADTRRGDAHRLLGREQSPGLVDYLKERSGQEIIQKTDHANLDFIACGARGTTTPELLASSRMAYFIGTLKRSYDVIIVDTPPLAAGGDAVILSTLTGNLAVVIRARTTERQLAQAKLEQLSRLPIRVLGAILNDVDPTDGYHYYYSAYLPGYEPVAEDGEEGVQLIATDSEDKKAQAS